MAKVASMALVSSFAAASAAGYLEVQSFLGSTCGSTPEVRAFYEADVCTKFGDKYHKYTCTADGGVETAYADAACTEQLAAGTAVASCSELSPGVMTIGKCIAELPAGITTATNQQAAVSLTTSTCGGSTVSAALHDPGFCGPASDGTYTRVICTEMGPTTLHFSDDQCQETIVHKAYEKGCVGATSYSCVNKLTSYVRVTMHTSSTCEKGTAATAALQPAGTCRPTSTISASGTTYTPMSTKIGFSGGAVSIISYRGSLDCSGESMTYVGRCGECIAESGGDEGLLVECVGIETEVSAASPWPGLAALLALPLAAAALRM